MVEKEVEAILFAAGRIVTLEELSNLLDISETGLIKEAIKDIKRKLVENESPLIIVEEGEGWKLAVGEKYLPFVHKINTHTDLTFPVMETLAVISWKQPIMQSDVIRIRSTKAYEHIGELEEKGFISRVKHGRSFAIKVTQKFMDYFDLPDAAAVRELFKDFKDVTPQKKLGEEEGLKPEDGELLDDQPKVEVYNLDESNIQTEDQEKPEDAIDSNGLEVYESNDSKEQTNIQEDLVLEKPNPKISNTSNSALESNESDDDHEQKKAIELAKKLVDEPISQENSNHENNSENEDDSNEESSQKPGIDNLL